MTRTRLILLPPVAGDPAPWLSLDADGLVLARGQIGPGGGCLGMELRISRHLDIEPVAGFLADESDQFAGVTKIAGAHLPGGHVAAQRHQVTDVMLAVLGQDRADIVAGRGDA